MHNRAYTLFDAWHPFARINKIDYFIILLQKGRGVSPLMLACLDGHNEVVDVLLEAGADVNQQSRVSR